MSEPDPVLDHITRTIVERFNPYRMVLFGSRARGDAHEDSDYDILVEMDSDPIPPERGAAIHLALTPRRFALDVIAYTPEEMRLSRGRFASLVSIAEAEGTVLYERARPGGSGAVVGQGPE